MRRFLLPALGLTLFASTLPAPAQQAHAQEATDAAAAAIPVVPPARLVVSPDARGHATLTWQMSRLESVIAYRIYRKESDRELKLVKEVKTADLVLARDSGKPYFVDCASPKPGTQYAVSAVDQYSGETKLSRPANMGGK